MSVFLIPLHFEKTLFHLPETLVMFQDLVDQQEQEISFTVSGLVETSTLTLNAGIFVMVLVTTQTTYFAFQRITVPVVNGFAEFNNIEIYEGKFTYRKTLLLTHLYSIRDIFLIILLLTHQQSK